jgi:hypothetical protein
MPLEVEDGTGLEDADAYISLEYADAYHLAQGNAAWAAEDDDAVKEAAIRRATVYIDNTYRGDFSGTKLNARSQALEWPRIDATDGNGDDVDDDAVPREVEKATAEAALRELASPGSLSPDVLSGQRILSEQVGSLSVTYSDDGTAMSAATPTVQIIDGIMEGLIGSSASSNTGYLLRA